MPSNSSYCHDHILSPKGSAEPKGQVEADSEAEAKTSWLARATAKVQALRKLLCSQPDTRYINKSKLIINKFLAQHRRPPRSIHLPTEPMSCQNNGEHLSVYYFATSEVSYSDSHSSSLPLAMSLSLPLSLPVPPVSICVPCRKVRSTKTSFGH